ncbi:MAG: hypothetical protein ABI353_12165 [Isosphaeraceae bacterium]
MRRLPQHLSPLGAVLSACGGVVLILSMATAAQAQGASAALAKKAGKPAKPLLPLTRYAPHDGLLVYAEVDGLDAHADAWKGTAAFQLLNETPAGLMLEDALAKSIDQLKKSRPEPKLTGAETIDLVKHILHKGALSATFLKATPGTGRPDVSVQVLRGAGRKESRPLAARFVGVMMGADAKASQVAAKPGGRRIVHVPNKPQPWSWWIEKNEDLVIVPGPAENADHVLEVIDGKRPNVNDLPARVALTSPEHGFQPVIAAFLDFDAIPKGTSTALGDVIARLDLKGIKHADFRWGIHDKALMSVTRITAPSPREGTLALLGEPGFSVATMPPIPKDVQNFTVVSTSPRTAYEQFVAKAKTNAPPLVEALDDFEASVKEETRQRFREDVLGRLGPKLAFFLMPDQAATKSAAKPPSADGSNPLVAILNAMPQVPRFTLLIEMSDPVRFGKSVDELLYMANRRMKSALNPPEDDSDDAKAKAKKESGQSGDKKKKKEVPAPEFRRSGSEPKMFTLYLPPQFGAFISARPAIAVGKTYLAIASTPDLARQALTLEAADKANDRWTPQGAAAETLGQSDQGMIFLRVSDPSATLPATLVNLPATLQKSLEPVAKPKGSTPGFGASGPGSSPMLTADMGMLPGDSGSSGGPSAPNAAAASQKAGAAKVPTPDALRKHLFPGETVMVSDETEIRLTTRSAFPNLNPTLLTQALRQLNGQLNPPQVAPDTGGAGSPTPP